MTLEPLSPPYVYLHHKPVVASPMPPINASQGITRKHKETPPSTPLAHDKPSTMPIPSSNHHE